MWPIKGKKIGIAGRIVAISYPLELAAIMHHYGSLIYIKPSGSK